MPLVSVIIPTHDRREQVAAAVGSVLAQSVADIELIVVDDGSGDGTAETLHRDFGDRLTLVERDNAGVSAARNAGVAAARGDLVAFLDSDDLWLADKLRAQLAAIEAGAAIVHCDEVWYRGGVRVNPRRHHAKPEGDIFLASLERCVVSTSSLLLRRDLFESTGGFDESLPACEDYDLFLRLARHHPFHLVAAALVIRHEGHADQLSHRHWGLDRFRVASLRKLLEEDLTAAHRSAVLETLRRKCAILAAGAEKRGRNEEAADYRAWAETHV